MPQISGGELERLQDRYDDRFTCLQLDRVARRLMSVDHHDDRAAVHGSWEAVEIRRNRDDTPRGVRGLIGSLVEMLAAIPSVVYGFFGIIFLRAVFSQLTGTLGFRRSGCGRPGAAFYRTALRV